MLDAEFRKREFCSLFVEFLKNTSLRGICGSWTLENHTVSAAKQRRVLVFWRDNGQADLRRCRATLPTCIDGRKDDTMQKCHVPKFFDPAAKTDIILPLQ